MINTDIDPAAEMKKLGFSANQRTAPTYGYSGTFTPEITFGHWTASAPGSNNAALVVLQRHYAGCTNRVGHTEFGGFKVRQGHGGTGRMVPLDEARNHRMSAARWQYWNVSGDRDNTADWPNRYGMSHCIDCTVDENIRGVQYQAFCAAIAIWLGRSGLDARSHVWHSVSTNRKIDITHLIVDGVRLGMEDLFANVNRWVDRVRGPVPAPTPELGVKMFPGVQWPGGDGYYQLKPDGGVITFGKAVFYGSAFNHIAPGHQAVHMATTADGKGYWILATDGGVFTFGNAAYCGSIPQLGIKLAEPATNFDPTPSGKGYYITCDDGGVFCFGDAKYHGNVNTGNVTAA